MFTNVSWKTTIASLISAIGSFILYAQVSHYVTFPPLLIGIAMFMHLGGLASFGIVAKDYNVTGGSIGQPSTVTSLLTANQMASIVNPPVKL